jgi:hypothetical protein
VTGTDTDTGVYYPAANQVALATNGTLALIVDSSQNVGIGTASPTYKLDVLGSTARIYNDSATLLLQRPTNSRSGQVLINNASGGIKYYAGTNGSGENVVVAHEFVSDAPSTGTVLARINSYGIGLGANTPSSGTGITFPATQSASTDANTLDDYEEGTFTPTIQFGGGSTGISYSSQVGRYTKIGKCVTFNLYCAMSSKGSSTGTFLIYGLPFTSQNTTAGYNTLTLWTNNTTSSLSGIVEGYVNNNSTNITFEFQAAGFYGALQSFTNSQCNNNSDFMVGGMYYTST